MLHFYQSINCKICGKVGKTIYSKKFDDESLKIFLKNIMVKKNMKISKIV